MESSDTRRGHIVCGRQIFRFAIDSKPFGLVAIRSNQLFHTSDEIGTLGWILFVSALTCSEPELANGKYAQ